MKSRDVPGTAQEVSRQVDRRRDAVLSILAASGDHPLMYAFPRGAFVAFDADLRYLSAGGHGLGDVGLSREMMEGRTIFEVFPPETSSTIEPHYRAALRGESTTWDVPFEGRIYSQQLAPVTDETGAVVAGLGITQDVTEARANEKALQDLTAMLAHDLRTPATVISGFAEILMAATDLSDDQRRDYTTRIGSAAQSMTTLLENALTAATLETGQLQPKPEHISMSSVVHDVVGERAGATALEVDLGGVGDSQAWIDRGHLVQVLDNLLTNAIKYGGGRVSIATHTDEDTVVLSIADNGPGVEPEFAPRLFERHSRSPSAQRSGQRGSGLGLYIARNLLTLNGGTIDYAPRRGGGAEFTLRLPGDPRPAG